MDMKALLTMMHLSQLENQMSNQYEPDHQFYYEIQVL